ncbi:MAG: YbhB/YbcL family Raf kinase inhibitor-like protein [Lachnospiraceae bacterium]
MNIDNIPQIQVTSNAFEDGGNIPKQYTGFGDDISPELILSSISDDAISIAIVMDDLDIPFIKSYNHWTIWNIPVMEQIPENIPYGAVVESLNGAKQGVGYGKNRYRGPKPPTFIRGTHHYVFHVFVLDCMLDLNTASGKKELIKAIDGHVLQYGNITGIWNNSYLE